MKIMPVDAESPEYQNAIQQARDSIDVFIKMLIEKPFGDGGVTMVKANIDGGIFFIWFGNVSLIPGGYLAATFEEFGRYRVGDQVAVRATDLVDWAVIAPNGNAFGAYTIELVMKKLNESEMVEMAKQTGICGFYRK